MDVVAFSGESFDVRDWINNAFKQPEAQQNHEQYATSLVMKLQLLIAKLNASLEEQCEQVSSGFLRPKVLKDVELLQRDAVLLQGRMTAVQEEMDKVNADTAASVQTLVDMDKLKSRIQATRHALREADNWTTLTTEIEDALDGSDLVAITEKLMGIQSSLKILSHVPDFEERVMHVEGLKNRLEALSSPRLVAAFNANDAEKARFFVKMFQEMGRSPQLMKYYRKCAKARLLRVWASVVESDEMTDNLESVGNTPPTVRSWSKKFFGVVETTLKEQFDWFRSVFVSESAADNLVEILLDVYTCLDPGLDFCIGVGVKQQAEPLLYLIDLKGHFNRHVEEIDTLLLDKVNGRLNARMREFARVMYQPFKVYVAKYRVMESEFLGRELESSLGPPSKDIVCELRNVSGSVQKLTEVLTAASERCYDLTEGCAYPYLVEVFEEKVSSVYANRYLSLMKRFDRRKTASHAWVILQQSLTLNQACGDLMLQLEKLDSRLAVSFLERTQPFLGFAATTEETRAIHQHDLFLLDDPASRTRLRDFHSSVKRATTNYPICGRILKPIISDLCKNLQSSTFSILFRPVEDHLAFVSNPATLESVWGAGDSQEEMPDFSFAPQEYITQIGQYLMTLPQHMEAYMSRDDNPALTRALQERVFPFCHGVSTATVTPDAFSDDVTGQQAPQETTPADFLLSCVARATCHTYQEHILQIVELSSINATKQLCTDIGYLGDILEDLGHPLSNGLKSIVSLLKRAPQDYLATSAASESSHHSQMLVSAVGKIRKIIPP